MPSSTGSISPGRRSKARSSITARSTARSLPRTIAEYVRRHDLELATWPGAEAQVAALADDIAYNNHDIDDGLRAGLFAVAGSRRRAAGRAGVRRGRRAPSRHRGAAPHPRGDPPPDRPHGVRSRSPRRGAGIADARIDERRRHPRARPRRWWRSPTTMRANDRALRAFLFERMYRHYRVNRMASKARRIVQRAVRSCCSPSRSACRPNGARQADGAGHARRPRASSPTTSPA